MSPKGFFGLIIAVIVLMVISGAVYIVPETQRAVLLQFGQLVKNDIKPGIHFKIPFIDVVQKFDVRILTLDVPKKEYLTIEKKPLVVDSFVIWKISDVSKYYTSTSGDQTRAAMLLTSRIDNGLRDQFAVRNMHEVISSQREDLMDKLTADLDKVTEKEFGIKLIDIRIKGIDLPSSVSADVYRRMRTEREKEAQQHRSTGREVAEGIKASADRQKIEIEADAYKVAQKTRGEGDELAADIYAKAYNQNKGFFRFYRSLIAYEQVFSNKSDIMVIKPDSDFFKYLKNPKGTEQ
jgi:membrane protease subunit HflC